MTAIRSHMWRTTERSWAMKTIVSPRSRCSDRRRLRICAWIETSSDDTGSSAITIFGRGAQPHALHELLAPRLAPCSPWRDAVDRERLADDRADGPARVQRRVGV